MPAHVHGEWRLCGFIKGGGCLNASDTSAGEKISLGTHTGVAYSFPCFLGWEIFNPPGINESLIIWVIVMSKTWKVCGYTICIPNLLMKQTRGAVFPRSSYFNFAQLTRLDKVIPKACSVTRCLQLTPDEASQWQYYEEKSSWSRWRAASSSSGGFTCVCCANST